MLEKYYLILFSHKTPTHPPIPDHVTAMKQAPHKEKHYTKNNNQKTDTCVEGVSYLIKTFPVYTHMHVKSKKLFCIKCQHSHHRQDKISQLYLITCPFG